MLHTYKSAKLFSCITNLRKNEDTSSQNLKHSYSGTSNGEGVIMICIPLSTICMALCTIIGI